MKNSINFSRILKQGKMFIDIYGKKQKVYNNNLYTTNNIIALKA